MNFARLPWEGCDVNRSQEVTPCIKEISMNKITLTMDSTNDLGEEILAKLGITNAQIARTGIVFGSDIKFDGIDAFPEDIYKAVEVDGIAPKTNAPTTLDYREMFEKFTADGGSVIHFNISQKLSVSHENAKKAAEDFRDVYVIDSKMLSAGIGYQVLLAHKMIGEGKTAGEIYDACLQNRDKISTSFIIKDLKYLHRGGRASGLKLLGANLLKIRPSLLMDEQGRLVPGKKFKGEFGNAVMEFVAYKLEQFKDAHRDMILVHSSVDDPSILAKVKKELETAGFNVTQLTAGTAITVHCGRNTIGLVFYNN